MSGDDRSAISTEDHRPRALGEQRSPLEADNVPAWPSHADGPADVVSRLLHVAIEQTPHAVIVVSEAGSILLANRAANRIFASAPGELLYRSIDHLIPEAAESRSADRWGLWSAGDSSLRSRTMIVNGRRLDGTRVPLEVGLSVVTEQGERFIVVSMTDITERLNLEARLAAAAHDHLGFQRLIADIAARFAEVDLEGVDRVIVETLQQLAEALQLDRAVLWRKVRGEAVAVPVLHWTRAGAPGPAPVAVASIPWVIAKIEQGEPAWFTTLEDVPDPVDRGSLRSAGSRSGAMFPLATAGSAGDLAAVSFDSTTADLAWPAPVVERLRLVASLLGQTLARKWTHVALEQAHHELGHLRDRLAGENARLRDEVKVFRGSRLVVSESEAVKRALAQVEQVAPTPATVLLLGETGSGKEVFAQAIHDSSPRHQRQMVRVSCAAIPGALIESELFGRERGAFTGALSRQIGRFEAAHQSTLFLDEIGELPADLQVKLLRVLQERVFERLGSTQPIKVDVRIIAATNRNLEQAVADKAFREDLFYRLNVFPIVVPPLRERTADIPGLVWAFIDEFSKSFGKRIDSISKDSLRELQQYPWPGNVRELRNVIERAVIVATDPRLVVHAPRTPSKMPQSAMTLEALEIEHVRAVLDSTNWRVRGPGGAAERLGLKPTTLESRMARLGIKRKQAS
jgi:PAS domain S-box-containing protein